MHWRDQNLYKILVRKLEAKRSLGTPGRREEDNFKINLRGILKEVDRIYLVQDRDRWLAIFNLVMNLTVQ
jgi:hypothetical protein